MELESGSAAGERGRAGAGAGGEGEQQVRRRSRSAPPGKMLRELTARERRRAEVLLFTWQAVAVVLAYDDMTEEDVEDEYRRAGKLHKYDPDTELEKRIARLARRWPPPVGFMPEIDEYLKLLDDDEREDDVDQQDQEKD
ncbi:unnamed protein product [Urochloa humidicola]